MMWQYGGSWVSMIGMSLVVVAFLALVIVAIVVIARALQPRHDDVPKHILGERFARGEIDEEQYRTRLHTLGSTRRHGSS